MSKEAIKLALEALEDIKDDCSGCEFEWSNDYPLQAKAKIALEEALANHIPDDTKMVLGVKDSLTTQQEHGEPVAWMFEFPDKRVAPKFDSVPHGGNWRPLYTHPQPKRRAEHYEPLTDEQVDDLHGEANRGFCIEREDYFKAFRDAEAAHGIRPSDFKE